MLDGPKNISTVANRILPMFMQNLPALLYLYVFSCKIKIIYAIIVETDIVHT